MVLTEDQQSFNIFTARFKDLKYRVLEQERVVIDSAFAGNLPGLAYKYMDDTSLWWTILLFNGLQDPINDVKVGMTLKIPSRTSVISLLESRNAERANTLRV